MDSVSPHSVDPPSRGRPNHVNCSVGKHIAAITSMLSMKVRAELGQRQRVPCRSSRRGPVRVQALLKEVSKPIAAHRDDQGSQHGQPAVAALHGSTCPPARPPERSCGGLCQGCARHTCCVRTTANTSALQSTPPSATSTGPEHGPPPSVQTPQHCNTLHTQQAAPNNTKSQTIIPLQPNQVPSTPPPFPLPSPLRADSSHLPPHRQNPDEILIKVPASDSIYSRPPTSPGC